MHGSYFERAFCRIYGIQKRCYHPVARKYPDFFLLIPSEAAIQPPHREFQLGYIPTDQIRSSMGVTEYCIAGEKPSILLEQKARRALGMAGGGIYNHLVAPYSYVLVVAEQHINVVPKIANRILDAKRPHHERLLAV